uniref:Glycosyltransferase 2-like domain-containing protein n=1 Tax=viral metagenome TaxID=1070528 RepID=A0A6C0DRD8_9ZZZZ
MGKNKPKSKKFYPFVSVCTPTFNRRPFIENMFQCFRNQDYPKDRLEWIIVDDGTDKINDLVAKSNIPQIKYYALSEKHPLGAKRNIMHSHTKGSIIVYMDDDDYYPPDRISHAVERLESNKDALCAGSSEIYIYFKTLERMVQCGPYGPKHATAGTFAFRAELLKQTRYDDTAALAEERAFLKDYTIPFVQLDPMKSILVFSHEHNTFDKRKMLENPHPDYLKTSAKTVDQFISKPFEGSIKDFFMNRIDNLLQDYEPGLPKMKPDVLKQMKEIEAERAEMSRQLQSQQQSGGPIMLQQPGKDPIQLSNQDVVNIIQQQQQQIAEYINKVNGLERDLLNKNNELTVIKLSLSGGAPVTNITDSNNDELLIKINDLTNRNKTLESMVIQLQKQMLTMAKNYSSASTNVEPASDPEPSTDSINEEETSKCTPVMTDALDD